MEKLAFWLMVRSVVEKLAFWLMMKRNKIDSKESIAILNE